MEEVNHKSPDYQVILFVESNPLHPLTESIPLCLLPVANRPLLYYQLDMLSKSGVLEIYIVAQTEYEDHLNHAINEYKRPGYLPHMTSYSSAQRPWKIKVIPLKEGDYQSCDAIRACKKYIKNDSDLIFMNTNFISQFSLSDIVNHHKMNLSDFTFLLSVHPSFTNSTSNLTNSAANSLQQVKENIKYDFKAHDLYFISKTGRILSKTPSISYKNSISQTDSQEGATSFINANTKASTNNKESSVTVKINRYLFSNNKSFSLRSDLSEVGIYILNSAVKELIFCDGDFSSPDIDIDIELEDDSDGRNCKFQSLNYHVLPYLLKRQWYPTKYLMEQIPSLKNRKNRKYQLNYAFEKPNYFDNLLGKKLNKFEDSEEPSNGEENFEEKIEEEEDPLRVFGFVYDPGHYYLISKVTNINSYINLNKEIPLTNFTPRTPWGRVQNYIKKDGVSFATLPQIGPQSAANTSTSSTTSDQLPPLPPSDLVDASPKVGKKGAKPDAVKKDKDESLTKNFEEAVKIHKNAIKQTMIGSNVSIGSKSKINSSVIMNDVVIGDNVIIQNCVISDGVVIKENCNLNDVHIGRNYHVKALTKLKNETLSL